MNSRKTSTLSAFNHKSSVLCPSTTHITSQYLALEQLKAHQNMLSRAKGSVDTSEPKSLQSFLNDINRRKKSYWSEEPQLFSSHSAALARNPRRRTRSSCSVDNNREALDAPDDRMSASLNKSIQTAAPFPEIQSKVADKISWYLEAVSQGEFQLPVNQPGGNLSRRRHTGSLLSLSSSLRSGRIVKGDILEWHKDSFTTSPRPFSPRITVNNSAKSKVLEMRCYNSPRKRRQKNSVNSSETFDSFEDDDEDDCKNTEEGEDSVGDYVESETRDEVEEEEDRDLDEEDEKIEENIEIEAQPTKVKNIHEDWLKEQALRAQIRRKLRTRGNAQKRNVPVRAHHFDSRFEKRRTSTFPILTRDEEDKYLKFLCDVTEDILRSGIYTDSAIERAFQFHLQLCSKNADKEKLQQLLAQVLSGLKLPIENSRESNASNSMPSKSPSHFHVGSVHNEETMNNLTHALNQIELSNIDKASLNHKVNTTQDNVLNDTFVIQESQPLVDLSEENAIS